MWKINIESPYYNIIIKEDEDSIKDNNTNSENNINPKKCKIEYHNKNSLNYLEEKKIDLNNSIVITNKNFVDCLLYELNHNIIIRKFPFMIITQIIQFIFLNKHFIIENSDMILFLKDNDYKIIVNSINKSKIGKNEQLRLN